MTAYAFDLDGTLTDFETVERMAIREALREVLGHEPGQDLVSSFRRAMHDRAARSEGVTPDPRVETLFWKGFLASALGSEDVDLSQQELLRMGRIYREIGERDVKLYPEVPKVLRMLDGQPLLLLTNGPSGIQRAKLQTLGIEEVFKGIFISEEVGARKPDPVFFAAVEAAGFPLPDTILFGDDPHADIDGGKRAGMTAVWVNRHGRSYPAGLIPPDLEGADLLSGLRNLRS